MLRLGSSYLFLSHEQPRLTRQEALRMLEPCLSEPSMMAQLRGLLRAKRPSTPAPDDRRVIEDLAALIESRELFLIGEHRRAIPRGGIVERRSEPEFGFTFPRRRAAVASSSPAEDSALPDNVDAAAMADAIRCAARDGAAFCDT